MRILRHLLHIKHREVTVERRGFLVDSPQQAARIEQVGASFLAGYHAALHARHPAEIAENLNQVDKLYRGFAFEGAGMGAALLDGLSLRTTFRWRQLHDLVGPLYTYMLHVGYGWAMARLPWLTQRMQAPPTGLDPLYWWLAFDGLGFHQGYFHWQSSLTQDRSRAARRGYERAAFDQGLGRSLWFLFGGDVAKISQATEQFEVDRRSDLWSGIGLACGYAGAASEEQLTHLDNVVGPYRWRLAQGVAFAAEARTSADNMAEWTKRACAKFCGMSAAAAAELTWATRVDLPAGDDDHPKYEAWRQRISTELERMVATCPA